MSTCVICGEEAEHITRCKMCGEKFCPECGEADNKLCLYCADDDEENDHKDWDDDEDW